METFDELLLRVVDKTLRYTFGDGNAEIIYDYMRGRGCQYDEIPSKLYTFSEELRRMLGSERGQILGVAPILEEAILELLYAEMKVKFDRKDSKSFVNQVQELKEIYEHERKMVPKLVSAASSFRRVSNSTQLQTEPQEVRAVDR